MSWGAIGAATISLVGGAVMGGDSGGGGGGSAPAYTDPFGQNNRDIEKDRLMKLQANPSSVSQLPGYQFGLTSGVETLNRNFASTGQGGSGAEKIGLQQFAQTYAGNQYQNEMSTLSQLSGATQAPLSNANQNNLQYQRQQDQQSNQAGMFNQVGNIFGAGMKQWGNTTTPGWGDISGSGEPFDPHRGY